VIVRCNHTADLTPTELDAIRALLFDVFDDAEEEDFEHCLGGMHVRIWDRDDLIAHGSVVMRRLLHAGRALRAGYVEAVFVRADRQRQGHGSAVMDELERIVRGAYQLGALGSTEEGEPFYEARGWQRWRGPSAVVLPTGREPTPDDDGCIFVLPVSSTIELDLDGELACNLRPGDSW
jgi:aminoglycoside 2'-N-acetyltransferase I